MARGSYCAVRLSADLHVVVGKGVWEGGGVAVALIAADMMCVGSDFADSAGSDVPKFMPGSRFDSSTSAGVSQSFGEHPVLSPFFFAWLPYIHSLQILALRRRTLFFLLWPRSLRDRTDFH